MLFIVDSKISDSAKKILSSFGELLELKTKGLVYPAISGHPDIFFCQTEDELVIAPNLPQEYFEEIKNLSVPFIHGETELGNHYPETARYNAVVTENFIIHNFRYTDFAITRTFEDRTPVHVDQGYCRCNLLPLKEDHFITSDEGIYKVLKRHSGDILKVSHEGIHLEGFPNGFFGGCCGVLGEKVFINGNLKRYKDGMKVKEFLKALDYEIIELHDGPLIDTGSIISVEY